MKHTILAAAMAATLSVLAGCASSAGAGKSSIVVTDLTCTMDLNRPAVHGEALNSAGPSQSTLELDLVFKDKRGIFMSADTAFATYTPVLPGQESPFDDQSDDVNPAVASVTVTARDANDVTLPTSGKTAVPCQ